MCGMYELITWEELRPNHERNAPHSFVTLVWILSVALKKNKQNKGKGDQANGLMPPPKIMGTDTRLQCCALRNVEGSPVLWTCEIHGAQHMICMQKLRFSSCRRAKVRRSGTLGQEHCLGLSLHPAWACSPALVRAQASHSATRG